MTKSNLLDENNVIGTRIVTNCMMVCTAILFIVWIFNLMGIFVINNMVMTIAVISGSILFTLPRFLLLFVKKDNDWLKYVTLASCTIAVGLLYSLLTYHAIMLLVFPVVMSLLYFDRKLTIFSIILSIVSIVSSHLLSGLTHFVSDEPLKNFRDITLYGIIPRVMEFMALSIICLIIGGRAQKMVTKLSEYSEDINRNKEGLNSIIDVSQSLFGARDLMGLASLIRFAVFSVASTIQGSIAPPVAIVGVKSDSGGFQYLDKDLQTGFESVEDGTVEVHLPHTSFYFSVKKQKVENNILLTENGIGMTFYERDNLAVYVAMEFEVAVDDILLKNALEILYNNINIAITNTKLNNDIFKTQESIILSFAEISESKSRQTGQHVKRVSEYIKVMARYAGYSEERCEDIALAAMMHDIGKLMIPPEILEKPSRLTKEEFDVIKTHVTIGEELLKNSPGEVMGMAKGIALQHHERWDGKGYLGIQNDSIDFLSRYVAVADVFDALVSNRSYKKGWPPEEAYAEIISQSGKQFAPNAVKIFEQSYPQLLDILRQYPDDVAQAHAAEYASIAI